MFDNRAERTNKPSGQNTDCLNVTAGRQTDSAAN